MGTFTCLCGQIEDEVSGQEMATVSHVVEDGEAESQLTEVHEQTQEDTSCNAAENAQEYAQVCHAQCASPNHTLLWT